MEDRTGEETRLLGLAGLAVEAVTLTSLGIRVVQLDGYVASNGIFADEAPDLRSASHCRE